MWRFRGGFARPTRRRPARFGLSEFPLGAVASGATGRAGEFAGSQRTGTRKQWRRILVVDDHEAVRRGLRSALVSVGLEVCGEAVDGREAITKVMDLRPDLVILDVSMPHLGGLDAAREILRLLPSTKILIFTMHESSQIREEAARVGVHGVAVKSAPISNLLRAIDVICGS